MLQQLASVHINTKGALDIGLNDRMKAGHSSVNSFSCVHLKKMLSRVFFQT